MIRSLDHLVLPVRDIDKTVDFYCGRLGMRKEVFGNGRVAIHFGDQKFNLHAADGAPILPRARNPVAGGADFCLVADIPLDEVIRLLGERGITIERGPVDQTGARGPMRSVYMRDPDGNLVEICDYGPMSSAAEDIVGLYERTADRYDALRGRSLFERAWLDLFMAEMPAEGAVLDIGCGMGEPIARYIADRGRQVVGVDSSANMIALCQKRMPGQEWHVADMRSLSRGRRFAGLIAWDSFFHLTFDDQRAMFPVFAAHALPGAALMFTSGPAHGGAIGTFEGAPLYHASLAPDEYRAILAGNGFEVLSYRAEDPDCGGHTIWLARYLAGT